MSAVPDIKEKILLIILDPKLKHFVYEADALDETLINNTINIIRWYISKIITPTIINHKKFITSLNRIREYKKYNKSVLEKTI